MATISRFQAVASIGERIRLAGFLAWLMWLAVHLFYIIGFKNRLTTLLHWLVSFLGRGRAERTATSQQVAARTALVRLGLPGPTGPDRRAARRRPRRRPRPSPPPGRPDPPSQGTHSAVGARCQRPAGACWP